MEEAIVAVQSATAAGGSVGGSTAGDAFMACADAFEAQALDRLRALQAAMDSAEAAFG